MSRFRKNHETAAEETTTAKPKRHPIRKTLKVLAIAGAGAAAVTAAKARTSQS